MNPTIFFALTLITLSMIAVVGFVLDYMKGNHEETSLKIKVCPNCQSKGLVANRCKYCDYLKPTKV